MESDKASEQLVKVTTINLGTFLLFRGLILNIEDRILMDRNFLLMMKDTILARFNSLRWLDGQELTEQRDFQELIYKEGDLYQLSSDPSSYKGIKLIEGICLVHLKNLSEEQRPDLFPYPEFDNHITSSIQDIDDPDHHFFNIYLLISERRNKEFILNIYSSFRHWGHPYINYMAGLSKLYEQVTLSKDIDEQYTELLGSDLAFLVLQKQFKEKGKWFVTSSLVPDDHIVKPYLMSNTWPPPHVTDLMFGQWHKLPLIKCFELPDLIDPSEMYSDKSHSITKQELKHHLLVNPHSPIPTRRVIKSLLELPKLDIHAFLDNIDKKGFDDTDLLIGLSEKERELKDEGRFFALMSFVVRNYFVITENIIKENFLPLFKGITMADDQTELIKKMLDGSYGHGRDLYDYVSVVHHIDYSK